MHLGETQTPTPRDHRPLGGPAAPSGLAHEVSVLRPVLDRLQPNVMMVGPQASTAELLSEVLATCRQPVHDVAAWPQSAWPPVGTLVFRDIAAISRADQQALHDLLDERPDRIQVVSLSLTPVFPLVADGTFSAALFYRLNAVTLCSTGR